MAATIWRYVITYGAACPDCRFRWDPVSVRAMVSPWKCPHCSCRQVELIDARVLTNEEMRAWTGGVEPMHLDEFMETARAADGMDT